MRVFCIGDVHGQSAKLDTLLGKLDRIDPTAALWFVGDLVNRGPDSAGVLRRVRSLGSRATTVLGNHDLALLAMAADDSKRVYADRGLHQLLAADDADQLISWLRTRPLLHHCSQIGWTMVHAGVPPGWSLTTARATAAELEEALTASNWHTTLAELYGDEPAEWQQAHTTSQRLRFIANALTRQRLVHARTNTPDFRHKGTLASAPPTLIPWFAASDRVTQRDRIVFGHWSALGRLSWPEYNAWCVDTGSSWGGALSALELTSQSQVVIDA